MPSCATPHTPSPTLYPYTRLFRSLLFLEHVRSADPQVARRQDRLRPLCKTIAGCNPNRDTLAAIERSTLAVESVRHGEVPKAPRFEDRKSTRLNSSHSYISDAVLCYSPHAVSYTLSLHEALPISALPRARPLRRPAGGETAGSAQAALQDDRRLQPEPRHAGGDRAIDARRRVRAPRGGAEGSEVRRSEEHTSELQSQLHLGCRLVLLPTRRLLHSIPTRGSSDLCSTSSTSAPPTRRWRDGRIGSGRSARRSPAATRTATRWRRSSDRRSPSSPCATGRCRRLRGSKIGRAHV